MIITAVELQISNLEFMAKAIKIAAYTLNRHLVNNDLHEHLQSAYKPGHSTETALLKVQKDILCSLDKKNCVILLLLDISTAFDTVDHEMLFTRLQVAILESKERHWHGSRPILKTEAS